MIGFGHADLPLTGPDKKSWERFREDCSSCNDDYFVTCSGVCSPASRFPMDRRHGSLLGVPRTFPGFSARGQGRSKTSSRQLEILYARADQRHLQSTGLVSRRACPVPQSGRQWGGEGYTRLRLLPPGLGQRTSRIGQPHRTDRRLHAGANPRFPARIAH